MVARGSVWYKSGDSALITVRGISALLKVPYTVALRLSKTGQIPGKVELSQRTLYRRSVVEAWLRGDVQ